jgi:hypothetical protein
MAMSTDVQADGPVLTMPGAPPAFHVTAKPTGAIRNLDRGGHVKGSPLYTQTGALVTGRSIGARAARSVHDRRVRGMGAAEALPREAQSG